MNVFLQCFSIAILLSSCKTNTFQDALENYKKNKEELIGANTKINQIFGDSVLINLVIGERNGYLNKIELNKRSKENPIFLSLICSYQNISYSDLKQKWSLGTSCDSFLAVIEVVKAANCYAIDGVAPDGILAIGFGIRKELWGYEYLIGNNSFSIDSASLPKDECDYKRIDSLVFVHIVKGISGDECIDESK